MYQYIIDHYCYIANVVQVIGQYASLWQWKTIWNKMLDKVLQERVDYSSLVREWQIQSKRVKKLYNKLIADHHTYSHV